MTKKQRQAILNKSNGHCWYCGEVLPEKGWHVDHLKPVYRNQPKRGSAPDLFGPVPTEIRHLLNCKKDKMDNPENHSFENMVPSCAPCNLFKSVFTLEDFRAELQAQVDRARKTSVNFRTAERFGLIGVNIKPIVFYFERMDL